jgi:hypothetical protein
VNGDRFSLATDPALLAEADGSQSGPRSADSGAQRSACFALLVSVCRAVALTATLLGFVASATEITSEITPEEVDRWIGELNSDVFLVREQATERLVDAGGAAVDRLAQTADGSALEAATRAVHVLLVLAESDDRNLAQQALDRLVGLKNRPVESRLAQGVLGRIREEAALTEVVRLGGIQRTPPSFDGDTEVGHIHLGKSWQGGDQGMVHLRDLRTMVMLSVHGAPISDDGIRHLRDLPALQRIELFGTQVTQSGIEALRQANPNADVDVRSGALLGVRGSENTLRAEVMHVVEGSAAAEGGLAPGDVIMKLDGQPVKDFRHLTELIARFKPGEKATLHILRDERALDRDVTFGGWQ